MKLTYQFANGETNEVEVSEEIAAVITELDERIAKSDRRETRRHSSLNYLEEEGVQFPGGADLLADLIHSEEITMLLEAISKLKPHQQELIKAIFFENMSVNEYAAQENVDQSAISHRLNTVYKNLKKLL